MTDKPLEITERMARVMLIGLWFLTCAWLLSVSWALILPMNFRDPDDALRLVQVRDLLNGQSWFDLTQYRIHPPAGVPMHWSRLVDLPIASIIFFLKPIFGQAIAERAALVIFPLTLLLILFVVIYAMCGRLGLNRKVALIAAAMLGTSVPILIQFSPTRIDHHGIQALFGCIAVLALLYPERHDGRMGLFAGLAMAAWIQVSLEGLPAAVAIGIVFGLRAIWNSDRQADLPAFLLTLTGASALLLFGTHYPRNAMIFWCDAMSPSFLLPLAATTLTLILAQRLLPNASRLTRALPLSLAGMAGAATYLAVSRQCLAGPFETLDPMVYKLWYRSVMEGLPFYVQEPYMQAVIILPALLGIPGALIALRRAQTDNIRMAWLSLIFMQIASFALALDVMRAMCFAHLLALPGTAVLLATLMGYAQRLRLLPLRMIVTASTAIVSPFGVAILTPIMLDNPNASKAETKTGSEIDRFSCTTWAGLRSLDALPTGSIFAPLDIGAHLLVFTHHSVVGTGHHRNTAGMKAVLQGLLAKPDEARPIIMATGARYLAFCGGENEVSRYKKRGPGSLIATLAAGKTPNWLQKIPMRPGETIHAYRIVSPIS